MIDRLQMFIALAQERHFGRAAEVCGITQPSLSSAIRHLEEQLGVQLVHRGSRFQGLTPEGNRVLQHALRIVGDVRAMRDEMRVARSGLSGHLRIGVIPTALPMIAQLTRPFLDRHPNISVAILSRTSAEILLGIESLQLDAGITYLGNEPLGRVLQTPLYRETYCFLCTPSHAFAGRKALDWAEAAAEPLCLLTGDTQNRRIINQHMADTASFTTPRVESNSTIALVAHVRSGGWSSIVPARMAELFTAGGQLVSVPMQAEAANPTGSAPESGHLIGLIAAWRDPQTPILAALMDEAQRLFHPNGKA